MSYAEHIVSGRPEDLVNELQKFEEALAKPAWMDRGSCRGMPTELFFPASGAGYGEAVATAKRICLTDCPVLGECLSYALKDPTLEGVWASTTTEDRRKIRLHLGNQIPEPVADQRVCQAPGCVTSLEGKLDIAKYCSGRCRQRANLAKRRQAA